MLLQYIYSMIMVSILCDAAASLPSFTGIIVYWNSHVLDDELINIVIAVKEILNWMRINVQGQWYCKHRIWTDRPKDIHFAAEMIEF